MQGCLRQRHHSFFFSLLVCQNFAATEMISQACCVSVRSAAGGAVLLGVVDGDNVALWPGLTTRVCLCGLFHLREEEGGRRGLRLPAAGYVGSVCILSSCMTSCKVTWEDVGVARAKEISAINLSNV